MLHFHRLDHGQSLPERHAIADAGEKLQHAAVHRRLDHVIAAAGLAGARRDLLDADTGLAAATQDVSLRAGLEQVRITDGWNTTNAQTRTVRCVGDNCRGIFAVDSDRHRNFTTAAKLKSVAR